jgi:hypothetical protein
MNMNSEGLSYVLIVLVVRRKEAVLQLSGLKFCKNTSFFLNAGTEPGFLKFK